VRVESHGVDKHGRLLGRLFVGDDDVNRALVASGWAWSFGGFAGDEALEADEERARGARKGLWAGDDPIRPSRWRDLHPSRP
ncbi:MAG: thermonuclease family protein, partial [Planctomycetota bacterium]